MARRSQQYEVEVVGHEAESVNVEGMNRTLRSQDVKQNSHKPRLREDRPALRAADGHEVDLPTYVRRLRTAVTFAMKIRHAKIVSDTWRRKAASTRDRDGVPGKAGTQKPRKPPLRKDRGGVPGKAGTQKPRKPPLRRTVAAFPAGPGRRNRESRPYERIVA